MAPALSRAATVIVNRIAGGLSVSNRGARWVMPGAFRTSKCTAADYWSSMTLAGCMNDTGPPQATKKT